MGVCRTASFALGALHGAGRSPISAQPPFRTLPGPRAATRGRLGISGATTGRCEDDGVGLGLQLGDKYGLVGQLDEGLGVPNRSPASVAPCVRVRTGGGLGGSWAVSPRERRSAALYLLSLTSRAHQRLDLGSKYVAGCEHRRARSWTAEVSRHHRFNRSHYAGRVRSPSPPTSAPASPRAWPLDQGTGPATTPLRATPSKAGTGSPRTRLTRRRPNSLAGACAASPPRGS
jgi:hypothetical protein